MAETDVMGKAWNHPETPLQIEDRACSWVGADKSVRNPPPRPHTERQHEDVTILSLSGGQIAYGPPATCRKPERRRRV